MLLLLLNVILCDFLGGKSQNLPCSSDTPKMYLHFPVCSIFPYEDFFSFDYPILISLFCLPSDFFIYDSLWHLRWPICTLQSYESGLPLPLRSFIILAAKSGDLIEAEIIFSGRTDNCRSNQLAEKLINNKWFEIVLNREDEFFPL